ncbi:serine hydrolase domain-containing protein [Ideonella sp. BN130291]|uniref:serine hydrolase domain-containing protein n=1 Tax=Ideonella sp. BN130291 TaxID=3112940 RepID=UPI002E26442E|nr:serine hydrolase domain-containing protein [Ideonella sp. BN130291]
MQPSSWDMAVGPVITQAIAEQRLVGAVVLVVHRGQLVLRHVAGLADREAAQPMTEDTIFRLASLTKPVVTAAALALVDGGRLSLDDAVTRWLPGFRPRLADGEVPEIRLRHLLNHTAGLSYGFMEPPGSAFHEARVSDGLDQPGLSLQENLRRLARVPLAFRPGEAWRYSLSLDVLGGVLEAATGQTLPDVVRQLVGEPLGWRDTGFTVRDTGRLATPYADDTPVPRRMRELEVLADAAAPEMATRFAPSRVFDPGSYPSGGAGMVGTAHEMLAFFEALRSDSGTLLPPTWSRAMRQNQTGELPIDLQGPGWGFGFGGAVLLDPAAAQVPHSPGAWQWGGVYGHCWLVDAAQELTMVTLTNTTIAGMMGRFPDDLRAAIYRHLRG